MTKQDPLPRLEAAREGRYTIEREIGEGGMALVCRDSLDELLPRVEN